MKMLTAATRWYNTVEEMKQVIYSLSLFSGDDRLSFIPNIFIFSDVSG